MSEPKPNLPLLRRVLRQIDEHPETWNQGHFAVKVGCGTTFCVAGWACEFSGFKAHFYRDDEPTANLEGGGCIEDKATKLLGLTFSEATDLFFDAQDRPSVELVALEIAARAGEPLWPTEEVPPCPA